MESPRLYSSNEEMKMRTTAGDVGRLAAVKWHGSGQVHGRSDADSRMKEATKELI